MTGERERSDYGQPVTNIAPLLIDCDVDRQAFNGILAKAVVLFGGRDGVSPAIHSFDFGAEINLRATAAEELIE